MMINFKKHLPRFFGKTDYQYELVIIQDVFSRDTQIEHTNDLTATLQAVFFGELPPNTRFYHNVLSAEHDVTPNTADDVKKLLALRGRIYCVVYPADPATIITVLVSIAVSVAVALLMPMPSLPNTKAGTAPPSPNNALAQRTNRQRLGGRIPDIFGKLWCYPDLLAPTYSVYIDHDEVEFSYMCLGRGEYEIHAVRDNKTPVEQIAGTTVQIYKPNSGLLTTPQQQIGNSYNALENILGRVTVQRHNSVNGQVLQPPDSYLQGSDLKVIFAPPNKVQIIGGQHSFNEYFKAGIEVTIAGATDLGSANGLTEDADNDPNTPDTPVKYQLDGTYTIASIDNDKTMTLTSPEAVNANWTKLATNNDTTLSASPTFSTNSDELWQGWFYLDLEGATGIIINLIAPNGLYTVHPDNDKYSPLAIDCEVQIEGVDDQGQPIAGTLVTYPAAIKGRLADSLANHVTNKYNFSTKEEVRRTAAETAKYTFFGKSRIRIRRTDERLNGGRQFVSQEVKVKDLYACREISYLDSNIDATTLPF